MIMSITASWRLVMAGVCGILLTSRLVDCARGQSFVPTSGVNAWNDDNNWSPPPFPNASGAVATIPVPTGALTINLGQPITIGTLTVNKAITGNLDTTISGTATDTLAFDGGSGIANGFSSVGTGLTTIAAPVVFDSMLTITQGDNDILEFTQPLSGTGTLTLNRLAGGYATVVALGAANTYSGATTSISGSAGDDALVVRLNDANALPSTTNVSMANSAILELSAGDFTRAIGTGAGEIQFSGAARNGWGAFGSDRAVNLGGALASVTWSTANFGQLVLGSSTSNRTVDFQNPLVLDGGTRMLRSYDGSAAIDGKISGAISGTGALQKQSDGLVSLTGVNTYSGLTSVQGGVLRLDGVDSASPNSNIQLGNGAVLGIGADMTLGDPASDFARTLGTAAGQIRLINLQSGSNAVNSGFSAHGGNRSVVLNGGAGLTWGSGSFFEPTTTGTFNRYFLLSTGTADGTLEFKNPIDLNGALRTVVVANGSANLDAKLSGVLSGAGAASGLIKDNPGALELSAANTYEGLTRVTAGSLILTNATAIPGGITGGNIGNIEINSPNPNNVGVIGLGTGDFTSPLGSGPGQFQIIGSGGFAAFGADRVVNLGGASQQVVWGGPNFLDSAVGKFALSVIGADATVDFQNPIDLNGGALRPLSARNGLAAIDGVLSGVISGAGGGLQKDGGGSMAFTAANTYDAGTSVIEGRLYINNTTGSGVGTGDVNVNAGTLGGSGFIGTAGDVSNVTINSTGRLAPGSTAAVPVPDELTVFGNVAFTAATTAFDIELASASSFDALTVNGSVSLNGALNVTLLGGYTPVGGESFQILSATGSILGTTFSSTVLPTLPGIAWQVTYNTNNVVLTAMAAGIAGDYNGNGIVDGADYVVWRKNKGLTGSPTAAQGNGDGDGDVDDDDYAFWRARFGNTSGSGSSLESDQAVPESATLISLVAAALTLTHGRRRKVAAR